MPSPPTPLKIGLLSGPACLILLFLSLFAIPPAPAGEQAQERNSKAAPKKTGEPPNPDLAPALEKWEAAKTLNDQAKYTASLPVYREALTLAPREKFPEMWAKIQMEFGTALSNASTVESGNGNWIEADRHQEAAISAFRSAQEIFTKEAKFPEWAEAQRVLAYAFSGRGTIKEDQTYKAEGVASMRDLLMQLDRKSQPSEWAEAQTDLGILLCYQAESEKRNAAKPLLTEALSVLQESLEVRTRESMPDGWGMTQTGIGEVYLIRSKHGTHAEKLENLKLAEKHCLMALEVWSAAGSENSMFPRHKLEEARRRMRSLEKSN